mgnify:CR=1 FL=1
MAHYWKGGTSGSETVFSEHKNWVTASGGSTPHSAAPGDTDDVIFDAATMTNSCDFATANGTTILSLEVKDGLPAGQLITSTGSNTLTIKSTMTISEHSVFNFNATYTFIFDGSGTQLTVFDGNGSSSGVPTTHIKLNLNGGESMFTGSAARSAMTFDFTPDAGTNTMTLVDGQYPNMTNIGTVKAKYITSDANATAFNTYGSVDILNWSGGSVASTAHDIYDYDKEFFFEALTSVGETFQFGHTTAKFKSGASNFRLPVLGDARTNFGNTTTNTFNVQYHKLIIDVGDNASYYCFIQDGHTLDCNELIIRDGGRLYGPSEGNQVASAKIKSVKRPTIQGDWNFKQIADGIYESIGNIPTLPVTEGGTGLNTVPVNSLLIGRGQLPLNTLAMGSAGQVLKVNSGGTALEFGAASSSGVSLANDGNNKVVTATGSGGITGEDNLTFNGSTLDITGALIASGNISINGTSKIFVADSLIWDDGANFKLQGNTKTQYQVLGQYGSHIFYTQDGSGSAPSNITEVFNIAWTGNVTLGNNRDRTFGNADTAHDVAGKSLTISAGDTTAGTTNNIAGGDLILEGGVGKGTGAGGAISFKVANAGSSGSTLNTLATAMTIADDGNVSVSNDLTVSGNFTVSGTTTTVDTTNLNITDNILTLNDGETGAGVTLGTAGIDIDRGTATNSTFLYDESTDTWLIDSKGTTRTAKLLNQHGYIEFGPANASFAHIFTDLEKFYFNKEVLVETGNFGSHNDDLNIRRARDNNERILIQDNSMTFTSAGNDVLKIDGTNTRLGVGTTSPEGTLEVEQSTTTGHALKVYRNQSSSNMDSSLVFLHDDSQYADEVTLHVKQDGTGYAGIFEGGNVGIGTTAPDKLLHVVGSANDETVALFSTTGGTSGSVQGSVNIGLTHFSSDVNPSVSLTAQEIGTGSYKANLLFNTRSANSDSAPVERMRITSDGDVGIGTDNPQGNLHVVGASGDAGRIYLSDADDGQGAGDSLLITKSGSNAFIYNRDAGSLRLGSNNDSDYVTIDTAGRVGIGETSPAYNLEISSSSNAYMQLTGNATNGYSGVLFGDSDANAVGRLSYYHGDNSLRINTNGSEKVRVKSDGSLLVGATSMGDTESKVGINGKLRVGDIANSQDGSGRAYLHVDSGTEDPGGTSGDFVRLSTLMMDGGSGGNNVMYSTYALRNETGTSWTTLSILDGVRVDTKDEVLKADGVTGNLIRMWHEIDAHAQKRHWGHNNEIGMTYHHTSGGRLGIGTTSPETELHVAGSIAVDYALAHAGQTSQNRIIFDTNTQEFQTAATTRLKIDSNGNVGIGTPTPGEKLQVSGGNVDLDAGYRYGFRDRSDLGMKEDNFTLVLMAPEQVEVLIDSNNNNPDDANSAYFTVRKNSSSLNTSTELFRINEAGRVGIGTTSPEKILHIRKENEPTILIQKSEAGEHYPRATVASDVNVYTADVDGATSVGATSITIDGSGAANFASSGRAELRSTQDSFTYTGKTDNGGGNYTLTGIPSSGDDSIQIAIDNNAVIINHPETFNVDGAQGTFASSGTYYVHRTNDSFTANYSFNSGTGIGTFTNVVGLRQSIFDGDIIDSDNPTVGILAFMGNDQSGTGGRIATSVSTVATSAFGDYRLDFNAGSYLEKAYYQANEFNYSHETIPRMSILDGGNVGIGTTSPGHLLDVTGNVRFGATGVAGKIYLSADDATSFLGWNASGTDITLAASDDLVLHADDAILFQTEGTSKFGMHNGNFGIGAEVATTATAALHVDEPSLNAASLTYRASAGQIFQNENSEFAFGLHNGSPYPLYIQGRTNTNTARQMVLNPLGGNVGIGAIDADDSLLHVKGNNAILTVEDDSIGVSALSSSMAGIDLISGGMNASGSKYGTALKFLSADAQLSPNPKFLAAIVPRATEQYGQNIDGGMALDFAVTDNEPGTSNLPSVAMTIDHTGKVGIGTDDPGHLLEVAGGGSNGEIVVNRTSGAEILLQAQSATGVIGTNTNHDLAIKTNGTTRMHIEDGGNVGIGTTSPDEKLEIMNGTLKITREETDDPAGSGVTEDTVTLNVASGLRWTFSKSFDDPNPVPIGTTTDNDIRIMRYNQTHVQFYWNRTYFTKDVGIGTSNPDKKLDVAGDIQLSGSLFINDGTDLATLGPTFVQVYNTNGSSNATVKMYAETWGGKVGTTSSDDFFIVAHNSDRMKFDGAMRTTFYGSASADPIIRLTTKDTSVSNTDELGVIEWEADYDSDAGDTDLVAASISAVAEADFTATANTTALVFKTATSEAATEKMRITNDGRVGIGVPAPISTLDIGASGVLSLGNVRTQLKITNSTADLQLGHADNAHILIDTFNNATNNYFSVRKNHVTASSATELFRVNENGIIKFNNAYDFPNAAGSTGDVLQLSGTSLAFASQTRMTKPAVFMDSASQNITQLETTVGFNSEILDAANNASISGTNDGHILLGAAGYYRISYSIPINDDGSSGADRTRIFCFMQTDDNDAFTSPTKVAQSSSQVYTREASGGSGLSTSFIYQHASENYIRLRIDAQNNTDISTEFGESQISIEYLGA